LIVRHELIKRLHRRYQLEQIEIPFPIRGGYIPEKGDRSQMGYSLGSSNIQLNRDT
jgi:hypothetical protein